MITNGAPNDVLSNFNALTITVLAPLLTFVIYPLLDHNRIRVGPITRITFGFFLAMISGTVGSVLQMAGIHTIAVWILCIHMRRGGSNQYLVADPNYYACCIERMFLQCHCIRIGIDKISSRHDRVGYGSFLVHECTSSAIGEILLPVTKDPWLMWIWGAPIVALALQTIIFWYRFKELNNEVQNTEAHLSQDEMKNHKEQPV